MPPLPLLARGGQVAWRLYSAYEAAQTAAEAKKLVNELNTRKQEFPNIFKSTIEQLKNEI